MVEEVPAGLRALSLSLPLPLHSSSSSLSLSLSLARSNFTGCCGVVGRMHFLSMMEAKLPPGFRFHPRDEELICDYLFRRVAGDGSSVPMMVDVDLNKCEPWDLPETACVGGKEWYFYSLRDRKYATGQRTNRATVSGYWKATGKDRQVVDPRRGGLVGMRKTLVFYQGRAPKGKKTDWVMHEFRMEGPAADRPKSFFKEDWVLCRVFYKSRGMSSKTNMENCYDDTGSSSLPPLMDTFISFDQAPMNLKGNEQVPCFSSFPQQSHCQNPPAVAAASHLPPLGHMPMTMKGLAQLGAIPDLGSFLNPSSCDKQAIKAVLDHLTKMDGNPKEHNPAEGSSESYLTETGAPSMWNTF